MNMRKVVANINMIRSVPAIIAYSTSKQKTKIKSDINRWIDVMQLDQNIPPTADFQRLNWLLLYCKEFRNLFYNRIH